MWGNRQKEKENFFGSNQKEGIAMRKTHFFVVFFAVAIIFLFHLTISPGLAAEKKYRFMLGTAGTGGKSIYGEGERPRWCPSFPKMYSLPPSSPPGREKT